MKTQAKKLNAKTLKIGSKQTKAKLPEYKTRKRFVQGKRKLLPESLTMNRSSFICESVQESSSPGHSSSKEQLISEHNFKRRTKKYTSKKDTQHSTGPSLRPNNGPAEAQSARAKDRAQFHKQRNIGSPVIVEAVSENMSSLRIPEVFKQNRRSKKETIVRNVASMHAQGVGLETKETRAVFPESLNENDNARDRQSSTAMTSPSKTNRTPQRDKQALASSRFNASTKSKEAKKCVVSVERVAHPSHDSMNEANISLGTATLNKNDIHSDHGPIQFYSLKNSVAVVMPEKARFCFTGKLIVKVIYGTIEAYGSLITPESGETEIYSPRGYSNVSIETSAKCSQSSVSDIWASLTAEGVHRKEETKLVTEIEQIQPGTAVIVLSKLENQLTRFLNDFYPIALFPKIKTQPNYCWTDPRTAEAVLQSNLYVGSYAGKELIIDPDVAQGVADKMLQRFRANEWSCTLLAGGKNVGKSTAARYLINRLLPESKMVVLLDIDLGQTECTPPGCISFSLIEQPLMGPNFTHLRTPLYQLYIGDVNVSRSITRYIEGIQMLVDKLTNCPSLSRLPIVVNTMGFTQGIGWNIILFAIKLIRPSFVVQMMSEKPKNNYTEYLSKQVINRQRLPWASWSRNVADWSKPCVHELYVVRSHAERKSAPGHDSWNVAPYQQRELVMISYLSEAVQSPASSAPRFGPVSLSINDAVPYMAPFSSLSISVPQTSVPPTHVMNVINGNIVALCGIDLEKESQHSEVQSSVRVLNRLPLCACYGFGIVRGVDMEREEIFINTPLPVSMMRYVNCLAGCIPVPVTLLELNERKDAVPYTGGSDVLPMSREHRRGYFRMRYENVQNNS